jgi:Delta7-sterol 5-desaturase
MEFMVPWPAIFAFDVGRYLLTATLFTVVIVLIPSGVLVMRRVRDRLPRVNQGWHELGHSVIAAIVFSLVGLGVYHGAQHGLFRVYSEAAQYGWLYWVASLLLVIVAHDAYFYWAHRWMHRPSVFRRLHRTHHLSVAPTQWAAYSFSVGRLPCKPHSYRCFYSSCLRIRLFCSSGWHIR